MIGFQKLTDDNTADGLKDLEIVQKWWDYNKDIMETRPDNMPAFKPLLCVLPRDKGGSGGGI